MRITDVKAVYPEGNGMRITDVEAVYPRWEHLPEGAWQSHFWRVRIGTV